MIGTYFLAGVLATFAVALAVANIRRRRAIERFAELAGVRREPGESLDELLARAARRFRMLDQVHPSHRGGRRG